jgi:hypothetical protein
MVKDGYLASRNNSEIHISFMNWGYCAQVLSRRVKSSYLEKMLLFSTTNIQKAYRIRNTYRKCVSIIRIKDISVRFWAPPFLLALGGVISDYASTFVGLSIGFYETNPQYHPVWALLYFWGIISTLALFMPKKRIRILSVYGFALASYLGGLNNILVILGVFPGIKV